MTRPLTASRVLLVADRREPSELRAAPLRRYRLARLRLDGRDSAARHELVKRAGA